MNKIVDADLIKWEKNLDNSSKEWILSPIFSTKEWEQDYSKRYNLPLNLLLDKMVNTVLKNIITRKYFIKSVDIKNNVLGGKPVLKGTRFPLSQFLEELSDDQTISEICDDYDLNKKSAVLFMKCLALLLDKPIKK